ncbi:acyltransferase family protein [Providencia rettgeri]
MNNRILWLDYLRALACISVVLLHVSSVYVVDIKTISSLGLGDWLLSDYINSITRFCVPVFFMLSGYFFFSEKKPKIKNFTRLLLSLAFYSIIAYSMYYLSSIIFPSVGINDVKYTFFSEPAFYHLWFFYPLIVIYLISIFIKVRFESSNLGILIISFIFIVLSSGFSDITRVILKFNINNFFSIDGDFVFYFLYAALGACIKGCKIKKIKISPYTLIFIFVLSSFSIAYLTYKNSIKNENYISDFYSFTSPLVYLMSISLFILFAKLSDKLKPSTVISFLSKNSLAIYGIHAFFISILSKITQYQNKNAFIYIPIIFITTMVGSVLFSIILKKIDKKGYIS